MHALAAGLLCAALGGADVQIVQPDIVDFTFSHWPPEDASEIKAAKLMRAMWELPAADFRADIVNGNAVAITVVFGTTENSPSRSAR